MGKKVLLAIAFVAIAMVSGVVSGGIVSAYEMNRGSVVEAKGASQAAIVETVQTENEKIVQAESKGVVQAEKTMFSCGVSGCTQIEVHQHSFCGIEGCTQTGEHSHGGNSRGHHQSGHH